jgi:hypothetical protein
MYAQKEKRPRPGRFPNNRHRTKKIFLDSKSTRIYVGRQAVGHVQDGTFFKTVRGSRHFLRKPRAIAFDLSTLFDAIDAGAAMVEVTDSESGKVYTARIDDILRDGKRFDRGYGKQIFYLLSRWRHPNAPEQLTLFDKVEEARQSLATTTGFPRTTRPTTREEGL